jgi:hypothetical protein
MIKEKTIKHENKSRQLTEYTEMSEIDIGEPERSNDMFLRAPRPEK